MAGAASNNQQNPESGAVVIVPERKVRQNFSSTQETPSKGVNTRKSRKTSSQVVEIEDTDSGPNDGDDRLSDGDYGSEKKKSSREKEEEKIKKQMTWVTDWKWKVTPSKKRELQLNEYWNMILTRDREIRLLKETIKKKDERIKGLRDEKVKELNERLRGKNTKIGDIQRGKDSLKEHLKEVRSELEKLKRDVDEKDIAISGMTAERLKLLDKSDMPFLPDDTVTAIFNKLFRETREWVKKWGIADWSTVPAEHTLEVCERILQMKPANFASQGAAQAILMGKIPLKVVLLAIINGTLCLRTFMRPFDSIKTHADQDPATRGMDRLQVVFNYLRKHTASAAHRFRALVLLAYSPPDEDGLQLTGEGHPSRLNDLVKWSSQDIFQSVLRETSLLTMSTSKEKVAVREAELLDIARHFLRASLTLLAQYPFLQLRFRGKLMDVGFCQQHSLFTWHRAMKLKEEDEDEDEDSAHAQPDAHQAGIAGKPLDLVIEPTVLRSGEKDGTGYDNERVLLKAIPWVVKPRDLEGASKVGVALDMSSKATDAEPGATLKANATEAAASIVGSPIVLREEEEPTKPSEGSDKKDGLRQPGDGAPSSEPGKETEGSPKEAPIKQESDAESIPALNNRNRKRPTEETKPATKKQRTSSPADQARHSTKTPGGSTVMYPRGNVTEEQMNRALDKQGNGRGRPSTRRSDSEKDQGPSSAKEEEDRYRAMSPITPPLN